MRVHRSMLVAAGATAMLVAGCGGGGDNNDTTAASTPSSTPAKEVVAGTSVLEKALSTKLDGAVNCNKQKLPPADGKTVTCDAQVKDPEHGTLTGDLKLKRTGTTLSYQASLTYPGGIKIKAGVLGLNGGAAKINLTPGSSGSSGGSSGGASSPGY